MRQSRRIMTAAGAFNSSSYSYSGNGTFTDEGNGKWNIVIRSSGTFELKQACNVDIHCVGGGGSGGYGQKWAYYSVTLGGGGGGGGYTTTVRNKALTPGTYSISVGSGGTPATWASIVPGSADNGANGAHAGALGGDGGTTSAFGVTANGGKGGQRNVGGNGGSGGGAGCYGNMYQGNSQKYGPRAGGSNGSSPEPVVTEWSGGATVQSGTGQGTTTRDFGESSGTLRSGGGAGSGGMNNVNSNWNVNTSYGSTAGGDGGGGSSQRYTNAQESTWWGPIVYQSGNGTANYGGGGGGGSKYCNRGNPDVTGDGTGIYPGYGGSGIVLIRSAR